MASIQIIGLGASTPVGRTIWASAAAARAGVSGFSEHPFARDDVGEPIRIAQVPWLDMEVDGVRRYGELLTSAIDEAITVGASALKEARLGLVLGLPPLRPGRPPELSQWLSNLVSARYSGLIHKTVTLEFGHAAGYVALDAAMRGLLSSTIDACVVAGVDSYLMSETLKWIERCDQLHGAGRFNNAWGFIPGEAASAVVLTTARFCEYASVSSLGDILALGLSRETNLIKTDAVCIGEGLTSAFRSALMALGPEERIQNVFCDLNGEPYRADEFGFAALRTKERFRAATEFIAPADIWGDVGAASVPLHIALAVICHRKRYSKGSLSLTWASSESGERGAAVIRAADSGGA